MRNLFSAAALAVLLGCAPKAAPTPPTQPLPPPPPPARIPQGCAAELSGTWVHQDDPSFRYLGRDDGKTLLLVVERLRADGGTSGGPEGRIHLERTPQGFVGVTRAEVYANGRTCLAEFPTEVVACEEGALRLETAPKAAVDEACQLSARPVPGPRLEQRLVRQATPGANAANGAGGARGRDGGTPDAGAADAG
jgi:hypothetical protein